VIAILACKFASRFYIGLVLCQISKQATLPLYAVKDISGYCFWDIRKDEKYEILDGVILVPAMRSKSAIGLDQARRQDREQDRILIGTLDSEC
jgi:hypothetical protein